LSRQSNAPASNIQRLSQRAAAAFESFVAEKAIIFGLVRLAPRAPPNQPTAVVYLVRNLHRGCI